MDATQTRLQPPRRGFTLVELLVVIIIITMLAGMALVAGTAAIRAAKRATIILELSNLSMALDRYKSECGDYPPDCFNVAGNADARNAVVRHFRKRFPRYRPGTYTIQETGNPLPSGLTDWDKLRLDVYNSSTGVAAVTNLASIKPSDGLDILNLTPASALAFFLGGMPVDEKPGGFSANPSNPFARGGSRTNPYFEMDETRYVVDAATNLPQYVPKYIKNPANSSLGVPYVYFRARSGAYGPRTAGELRSGTTYVVPQYINSDVGLCVPYAKTPVDASNPSDTTKIDWYANDKFQIIAAGLDGQFGVTSISATPLAPYRYFNPDGNNLDPSEDDNLSSFTPGQLEDGVQ